MLHVGFQIVVNSLTFCNSNFMNEVLKVRINYLYISNEQYKINKLLSLEEDKKKNKDILENV